MFAPFSDSGASMQLSGLTHKINGAVPKSKWGHAMSYVAISLVASLICMVVAFFILLFREIPHMGEIGSKHNTTAVHFWYTSLILSVPLVVILLLRANLSISRILAFQKKYDCTYADAYFVLRTPLLRDAASKLSSREEMHGLINEARLRIERQEYLTTISSIEKLLAGQQGEHAASLKLFLAEQRLDIKRRS